MNDNTTTYDTDTRRLNPSTPFPTGCLIFSKRPLSQDKIENFHPSLSIYPSTSFCSTGKIHSFRMSSQNRIGKEICFFFFVPPSSTVTSHQTVFISVSSANKLECHLRRTNRGKLSLELEEEWLGLCAFR
ncbi:hypothetical protein CEXT_84581 [Caerostris extrusa]|uniref:Uncharacterized protein n=1 Tax=Caerostris extrusa TaxID=172846 RepID=A0AAV4QIU8_CAEEX|nr:hypothetical protein CEXT_84581 [Caerostris extrusa]